MIGWLVVAFITLPAWAQQTALSANRDERVTRLQALPAGQERRIEALQQQIAAAARQDTDQAHIGQTRQLRWTHHDIRSASRYLPPGRRRHEGSWEYAAGLDYYTKQHFAKPQTDVVKVSEIPISDPRRSLVNVNDDALIWRGPLQVAF